MTKIKGKTEPWAAEAAEGFYQENNIMRRHPMPLAACKAHLKRHKLELFDLGLDFDFREHLYFILSSETGLPFMDEVFILGDVEKVVAILDSATDDIAMIPRIADNKKGFLSEA